MDTWKLKNSFDGGFFIDIEKFHALYQKNGINKLPKCQSLLKDYPDIIALDPRNYTKRIFISHRWDRKNSPDVRGWQIEAIAALASELIAKKETPACFWYDYCSLPQSPRTTTEEAFFKQGLKEINSLCSTCTNICLVSNVAEDDRAENIKTMLKRGWILVELCVANHHEKTRMSLFEGHNYITDAKLNQPDWQSILPNIIAQIPFYEPKLIEKWFKLNDIKCTNGSDLKFVAQLFHYHMFQYTKEIKSTGKRLAFKNNKPISLTADEIIACYINRFSLSPLYPKKYFNYTYDAYQKIYTVTSIERPTLPLINRWKSLSKNEFDKYRIDPVTGRSAMYPGIIFGHKQTKNGFSIRPTLIKLNW